MKVILVIVLLFEWLNCLKSVEYVCFLFYFAINQSVIIILRHHEPELICKY